MTTHRTITAILFGATLVAAPAVTHAEPIGNVCHITGTTDTIPEGSWELTPTESVGTHSISGMWCGPIGESVTPVYTAPPVEDQPLSPDAVDEYNARQLATATTVEDVAVGYPPQPPQTTLQTDLPPETTPAGTVAAVAPQTATQLPATGIDNWAIAVIAALFIAAGAAIKYTSRPTR